jgi:predicted RNA-binding protein
MAFYLDLFSPETYEAFSRSDREITGFRKSQEAVALKINPGDKLLCYMTKLSRWIGLLEVTSTAFEDSEPRFYPEDDPFTVRFHVRPIAWLEKEKGIPIRTDHIWTRLSFTKKHDKNSSSWTGRLRSSLTKLSDSDGNLLEQEILRQVTGGILYPINEKEYQKLTTHRIKRLDKTVQVSVPENSDAEQVHGEIKAANDEVRESTQMQALIAQIGSKMGLKIWLPKSDRQAVLREMGNGDFPLLSSLPLNYDETTLRTVEQIDVLWLRGRAILRAFEVEHTTSIYSGILRMADLLALQPNMDINLHIVAPTSRRDKVFQELLRPVFSLLEKGPLYEYCTYLSYDSVRELSKQQHLAYLSDSVLDEYAEQAE